MISIVNGHANRVKVVFAGIGLLGLAVSVAGWIFAPGEFFVSYLFAHEFFLGISLGSLGLLMIHHLTSGYWGYSVRRFLESAVGTLPLLALLFVPIFFGLPYLYPWKNPSIVAEDEILRSRISYLNTPGFIVRSALIWIGDLSGHNDLCRPRLADVAREGLVFNHVRCDDLHRSDAERTGIRDLASFSR